MTGDGDVVGSDVVGEIDGDVVGSDIIQEMNNRVCLLWILEPK